MTEQKLLPIDHCRHLAFAAIGGFFGGYALLCRGGILGSSQTMNLLELVSDALFGRGSSVLLHLLCLVIYVVGVMSAVIVPHVFHVDMRRLSPCITAAAAIAMGFFPADMTPLVALYPVFFSMSIQWSTFAGARGFQSATIFNSNNTKQASLALAHYLCEGEREQLTKLWFYGSTLLAFHAGAVWSWLARAAPAGTCLLSGAPGGAGGACPDPGTDPGAGGSGRSRGTGGGSPRAGGGGEGELIFPNVSPLAAF